MVSIDIAITINGESILWPKGFDELSLNRQVVVENYLRFALKALEIKRSEKQTNPKEPIGQILRAKAEEITTSGKSLANWLDSNKQLKSSRETQLHSALSQFLKRTVQRGIHLSPIKNKEWARSVNETLLWLVYTRVGLAHALLVICAFSTKKLSGYTFEEIIYIFDYVIQNQKSLHCEALETEAKALLGMFSPLRRHHQAVP